MIFEDFRLARIQSNLVMPEDFAGYDLLERACLEGLKNEEKADENFSKLEYNKMLEMLEDFFKRQDSYFYDIYRKVITSKNVTIYDANKINPQSLKYMNKKDENGFKMYGEAMLIRKSGKYRMILPVHGDVNDLYTFVHEIAHMFDANLIDNAGLNILSEVTPFAFEKRLSEYLIEKGYNDDAQRYTDSRKEYIHDRSSQLLNQVMLVNTIERSEFLTADAVKEYILGNSRLCNQLNINESNYAKYYKDNISGMTSVRVHDITAYAPYVIAQYVVNKSHALDNDRSLRIHASTLGKVDQYRSFELIGEECYDELEDKAVGYSR